MAIQTHADHSLGLFLRRTVAAQLHLAGAIAAFIGMLYLIAKTAPLPDSKHLLACIAYGVPAIAVFGASALYHFLSDGFVIAPRLERVLHDFDHIAIYVFIAGSYTPFIVNSISPANQTALLFAVWISALVGSLYTAFNHVLPQWARHRYVYTALYLVMGWILLFNIGEIARNSSRTSVFLLIAGGLSYSIGAVFYALKRPRLFEGLFGSHELWHVMVLLGYAFHFALIAGFYSR